MGLLLITNRLTVWPFLDSASPSADWPVGNAEESAEPPLPPTWIVIFFVLLGGSTCPTFSLILGWDGSGTAALACLSSLRTNS